MVLKMSEGFPPEELAHDPARLVPGTLIRVHTVDREVEDNGALWILEEVYDPTNEANLFWARAVATGYRYLWYTFEFLLPDEAEAHDG